MSNSKFLKSIGGFCKQTKQSLRESTVSQISFRASIESIKHKNTCRKLEQNNKLLETTMLDWDSIICIFCFSCPKLISHKQLSSLRRLSFSWKSWLCLRNFELPGKRLLSQSNFECFTKPSVFIKGFLVFQWKVSFPFRNAALFTVFWWFPLFFLIFN